MAPASSSSDDVVAEALSWLGTPYHHCAGIKGTGVDCAMLLLRVFQAVGVVDAAVQPDPYPPDWHMHRSEERLLTFVERYADKVADGEEQPGDVALFHVGRCIAHGGIYIGDGLMVHADLNAGQVERFEVDRWKPRLNSRDHEPRLAGFWRVR